MSRLDSKLTWLKNSCLKESLLKSPEYFAVIVALLVSLTPLMFTHKCFASIIHATFSVFKTSLSLFNICIVNLS